MKNAKDLLRQHGQAILLYTSLALGILAQIFFVGRPLGLSWLLFVIILLAALVWHGRRAQLPIARRNLWLWPPLLFFASMVFLRANPFLTFLNIIATLGLLAFIYFYFAAGTVSELSFAGILTLPVRMASSTIRNLQPVFAGGIETFTGSNRPRKQLAPVVRGSVIALPVMIVFTFLLASADLVFSAYLQRLIIIDLAAITPNIGRGLFIALVTMLIAGGTATAVLRGLRQPQSDESWLELSAAQIPLRISLGSVESATILILVSSLFIAFLLLQFTYLFGGQSNISREGFTYAEYARRGFFELVLVASLSLALIMSLNWLTRRNSKQQIKRFNKFSSLLVILVLLILVAAFWRMRLYEQAYGYTELRLIVLVFELWLALLLLWFLVTVWHTPERFATGMLIAAIGFVATLNLINPDALIVRHNLQRYQATGDLDVAYLITLSQDAVPLLVNAYQEVRGDDQPISRPYCYEADCETTMPKLLAEELDYRYQSTQKTQNRFTGLYYHRARHQAYNSLSCFHAADTSTISPTVSLASCRTIR